MVDITSYTYSDVTTVTHFLSEIAMIFSGNAFVVAAKLAAIIGIVGALFSALSRDGKVSPSTFFWPLLISVILLVPKVNLVVEDRAGGVARVNNLPIGFAGPISLITQFGQGIAGLMTDHLGLDDNAITMDNGHLVALRAPSVYTQILTEDEFQGTAATFPNGLSPIKDTSNYVKSCLAWKNKADNNMEKLRTMPVSSMRVADAPHTVAATNNQSYSCGGLYDALMAGFESSGFQDRLDASVAKYFGKYENDTTTAGRYRVALEDLVGTPSDFYKAAAFSVALTRAKAEITTAAGSGSHQAALRDALNQKLEKNYGAAAMIFETISATIGFIEIWSYSIMPLALLLLIAGSIGIRIGVKYLWLLVWVQLWYPTLLIVIAYLDAKAGTIAFGSSATPTSYEAFMAQILRLQDVGYMNMSMATALSMFLVFGTSSAVAANFQRDLSGGEHYDPKKNSPDTLSRAATNQFQPHYSYSPAVGSGMVGVNSEAARSFGAYQISIDSSRASGVSATQLASFAATGTLTTGTSVGSGSSVTRGTQVADGRTSTDALSGNGGSSQTISAGQGASQNGGTQQGTDTAHSMTGSTGIGGEASLSADMNMTGAVRAAAGALSRGGKKGDDEASAGAGANAGSAGDAKDNTSAIDRYVPNVEAGAKVSASARTEDRTAVTRTSGVDSGDAVSADIRSGSSATASINQTLTDTDTKQRTASTGIGSTEERHEQAGSSESVGRTDSESEAITGSNITTRRASGTIDIITASANIAGDSQSMARLREAVSATGLSDEVANFMDRNRARLDATFSGNAADEDAKFALAANYVMQGFDGALYSDDPVNGQARREAVNALSDDIISSTGFGTRMEVAGAPSLENLPNYAELDPSKVKNAAIAAQTRFALSEADAKEIVANAPTVGSADDLKNYFEGTLGRRFEDVAPGAVNGIMDMMVKNVDRQMGPIAQDAEGFAQMARSTGYVGALQNFLWKENADVRREAVMDAYRETVRNADGDMFFPNLNDRSPEEAASIGAKMVDARMAVLNGAGVATTDDKVGRFMALSQLEAGASAHHQENMAAYFRSEKTKMAEDDPTFKEGGITASRIAGAAMLGANANAMADAYMLSQQYYRIGQFGQSISAETGREVNSEGVGVRWSSSSGTSSLELGGIGSSAAPLALSAHDRDIAIRTVIAEAGREGDVGQAAVAFVMRNRFESGQYGNSVADVALAPKQFSAWNAGAGGNSLPMKYNPGDAPYERAGAIVDAVFNGQVSDPTNGATHYYSPRGMEKLVADGDQSNLTPRWLGAKSAESGGPTVIGNHVFVGKA